MTAVTWWTSWPGRAADGAVLALGTCMSNMTLTRPSARPSSVRRALATVGSYTGTASRVGTYTGAPSAVGSYTGTQAAFGSYVSSQR